MVWLLTVLPCWQGVFLTLLTSGIGSGTIPCPTSSIRRFTSVATCGSTAIGIIRRARSKTTPAMGTSRRLRSPILEQFHALRRVSEDLRRWRLAAVQLLGLYGGHVPRPLRLWELPDAYVLRRFLERLCHGAVDDI